MVRVHSASPVGGLKRLLKSQKQPLPATPRPRTWATPIECLPVHILYDIGHCVDTRDVLHLSLCSRQLRTALQPLLYATVELTTNKHCKSALLALSKNPDAAQHVRRLLVRPNALQWTAPGDKVDEDGIASLLAAMAGAGHLCALEAFEWGGIEMPHDALWLALRKSCRSLRRISTTIGEASLSASSPLWDFSDLRQVALNVKCHSLDWLSDGLPKTEKLPRKFWAMLLERCPRLEDLTIGGPAPSPRIFDARHVTAGRWPRLKSISLGGVVLVSGSGEHQKKNTDDAAFQSFFALHTSLRSITLQHAEGSAHVPSVFSFPSSHPSHSPSSHPSQTSHSPQHPHNSLLPHLESFAGPLRLARSLPASVRMRTLRKLTLTALHHSASAIPPTCAVLQEEFAALRELGVWVDLSFGQGVGGGALSGSMGRRSAEKDRERRSVGGPPPALDDLLMLRALLAACPRLTHLDLACFTRPAFSFREFSRTLQSSAPMLESFSLVKLHKSSDDAELAGGSSTGTSTSSSAGAQSKAAVRLASENPRLRRFRLVTTLDAWLGPREGRVKVLGVYEVVRSAPAATSTAATRGSVDLSSSRESVMSGPQSAPASVTHFPVGSQPMATATPTAGQGATAVLHAHEYGQRNITGRMYSRHLVVPIAPKERPLSYRDGAPPSSFPQNLTQSMYASLSRVGSMTSTVGSYRSHYNHHHTSRPQSFYASSNNGHSASEESHDHDHQLYQQRQQQQYQTIQFQTPPSHVQRQQQQQQQAAAATTNINATTAATTPSATPKSQSHSRWGSMAKAKGHRRGVSSGSASNSASPSAWGSTSGLGPGSGPGSGLGSGSGLGLRSRRASLSNVVGSIAHALVGMKHGHYNHNGHGNADRRESGSVVSSGSHGSTSTSTSTSTGTGASSGVASSVSRSASASSGGASGSASGGGSPVVAGSGLVRGSGDPPRQSASPSPSGLTCSEDGFVLV